MKLGPCGFEGWALQCCRQRLVGEWWLAMGVVAPFQW